MNKRLTGTAAAAAATPPPARPGRLGPLRRRCCCRYCGTLSIAVVRLMLYIILHLIQYVLLSAIPPLYHIWWRVVIGGGGPGGR